MTARNSATQLIELTPRQVSHAMKDLVDHIQTQWPDEEEAANVADFLRGVFERNLLRHYVAHRIPDCPDISWLIANDVRWTIKSSVDQFVTKHLIRVQLSCKADRQRFIEWRDN